MAKLYEVLAVSTRTLMRTGNQLYVQGSIVFNQNIIKYPATDVYTPYELNFSN